MSLFKKILACSSISFEWIPFLDLNNPKCSVLWKQECVVKAYGLDSLRFTKRSKEILIFFSCIVIKAPFKIKIKKCWVSKLLFHLTLSWHLHRVLCNVYCNTWSLKNLVSKCECVIYCYCSGNIIGVVMSCHYPSQCHVEDIYLFCILYPCPMSSVHCLSCSHLCSPDLFYKQCSPCLPLSGCCPTWSSNGFCCCCSDLFWF